MDIFQIASGNVLTDTKPRVDLKPVPTSGLGVVVKGDAADTQGPIASDDISDRIAVKRSGETIISRDGEFFHDLANIWRGHPTLAGTTGGNDQRIFIPIPFGLPQLDNVLDFMDEKEADLEVDFKDLSTLLDSGTYEIYQFAKPALAEQYQLHIEQVNIQLSGAGTVPEQFSQRNVAHVYLYDPDSVVSSVSLDIDGQTVVDPVDDALLQDLTNLNNEIETSGLDLRQVHAPSTANVREYRNRNIGTRIQATGAGSADFTLLRVQLNAQRSRMSAQRAQRFLSNN